MLSFVLGSDRHSLFALVPKTLPILNLVLLKGSHAEQSSLCILLVWLDSPTIESWNKENLSVGISRLVITGTNSKTIPKVAGRKNTGHPKQNALFRPTSKPRCEDEKTNFVLSTTHARSTRTWGPLHAWNVMCNACRSTTSITAVTYHPPSHKPHIYRAFCLISCYTYPWTCSLTDLQSCNPDQFKLKHWDYPYPYPFWFQRERIIDSWGGGADIFVLQSRFLVVWYEEFESGRIWPRLRSSF